MPFGTAYNQGQMPCDSAGPWADPCSVLADDGASASAANSTAWLVIRAPMTNGNAWNAGYGGADYGQSWTMDQLAVTFKGYVNSAGGRPTGRSTYVFPLMAELPAPARFRL